jgi:hypothetical protein
MASDTAGTIPVTGPVRRRIRRHLSGTDADADPLPPAPGHRAHAGSSL